MPESQSEYANSKGIMVHDQIGKQMALPSIPKRIISLVPSQTELLSDLGLEQEVVGITKFCIHPDHWFRTKTRIGGTKSPDIEKIRSLEPELVIANKEENNRSDIEQIERFCPVFTSQVSNRVDAMEMIKGIGRITHKTHEAEILVNEIQHAFEGLTFSRTYRCAYLIWKDPWMAAAGNTFINDMLQACGFENVFRLLERYPELDISKLREEGIEILFLSSEPYPFKTNHLKELNKILPDIKILLVDGEMFSWYGSRMKMAPEYFQRLLTNPE